MKTMRMTLLLALLMATFSLSAQAEGVDQEAGIRFLVATPQGEFDDNVDNPGFGLALHYGVRPVRPLTLGIGGDVMIYGSESRRMELPLVDDFDLTTTNNLADFFCFAQYRPLDGPVQPYGEARLGYHYLWTESKLEDDDWWEDDDVARETNYDDFATFWSVGGGVLVRVYEPAGRRSKPSVWIDFKVTYAQGAEAEYLTEGDVSIVNNRPVYTPSTSETDLMKFEVGVALTF